MFWRALVYCAIGMAVAIVVLRVAGIDGTALTVALAGVALVLGVSLRWVAPR
jgi:hypothetical protein